MKIRIDSEGRDVTDLYGLHDESDTILEVGMLHEFVSSKWLVSIGGRQDRDQVVFDNWLVFACDFGQWVAYSHKSSHLHKLVEVNTCDDVIKLIEALKVSCVNENPTKEAPHQWKVGDWFVVDEKHDRHGLWVDELHEYLGIPQCVEYIHSDMDLKSNDWWWHPSWCRPCAPPKAEPASTRFQPSIEYVGIHDAI